MAKERQSQRPEKAAPGGLAEQAAEALSGGGRHAGVWIREDGAVCFGDECAVLKGDDETGILDLVVRPDRCGQAAGAAILEHLIKTGGKGVRITIPPEVPPK